MKFVHIADVHLGADPEAGRKRREVRRREIWEGLERAVDLCFEERADLLLIAGDLFHRQPLMWELREVSTLFTKIESTQVVLCAGNHDYIKENSYYRTFPWGPNVHMIRESGLCAVDLPQIETAVYGFSYFSREMRERPYEGKRAPGKEPFEILMVHGGDEKHVPVDRDGIAALGYDYTALGHIHKPQILIPDRMAYCGALEPIDRNDVGPHGCIVGEITEEGCQIRFEPLASRQYIHMEVEVTPDMSGQKLREKIRAGMEKQGVHNIYRVLLRGFRDPQVRFDYQAFDIYGNVTEIADETKPAYNFAKIGERNRDNILGKLIREFEGSCEDSVEYRAMCEGVRALMETRRD